MDCEDADDLEAVELGIFRCKADKKAPQSRTSPDALPLPGGGSVYQPAIGKPPVGAQEIKRHAPPTDAEKIESAKHLKRILGVYDARGVWDAKQGNGAIHLHPQPCRAQESTVAPSTKRRNGKKAVGAAQ